jgi:hypothetical protein
LKQNILKIETKVEKIEEESKQKKEYSKEFMDRQHNLQKQYGQSSSLSTGYGQKTKSSKDDLGPEIMKLG